jgi:hypothetical protein
MIRRRYHGEWFLREKAYLLVLNTKHKEPIAPNESRSEMSR